MVKQNVASYETLSSNQVASNLEENNEEPLRNSWKQSSIQLNALNKSLIKNKAVEMINIRHMALKDQVQSLEKRRSEVILLINRYKQAEYINEDTVRNLKLKEREYAERVVDDPSLSHVLEAVRNMIKYKVDTIQSDKRLEKSYIRELFLLNGQYEKAYIDLQASEYILSTLEKV